ncbi:antigenic cell wall galactomanno protein-like protein [Ascodesmis nigricans]|uniref:Antigenic cell wall galactomanno protein-like protein n=1 Tax=Ascodesmis nigricans TaxID=341454 RepID=A0A4S2MZV2_9PEZI|nr:antigenic cell wall galactomanno protein-like protein [Ascodesmis nigricans]
MRFLTPLIALTTLCATVLADGASIAAAMHSISEKTVDLDNEVISWNGKLFKVFPVVGKSTDLLFEIQSGTKVAEKSANLTMTEALTIASATEELGKTVVTALGNIQEAKPKFKKLALTPAILLNLIAQQSATKKFGEATISKVPEMLQPIAKNLLVPIEQAFEKAIADYKK